MLDLVGRHAHDAGDGEDVGTDRPTRDDREDAEFFQRAKGPLQVRDLEERTDLGLVAQQHVDVVGDEFQEVASVAIDAEHVRQRQRDHGVTVVREVHDLADGLLGRGKIEEVALDVGDLGARDEALIDVRDAQLVRRAQVRRHRSLGVIGDEDVAASGRALTRCGDRQVHLDAHRRQVVRETMPEVVIGHLADIAAGTPECRDAGDRVRDRAAGHLDRGTHGVEERLELVLLDE